MTEYDAQYDLPTEQRLDSESSDSESEEDSEDESEESDIDGDVRVLADQDNETEVSQISGQNTTDTP